jgi:hypothetical protein
MCAAKAAPQIGPLLSRRHRLQYGLANRVILGVASVADRLRRIGKPLLGINERPIPRRVITGLKIREKPVKHVECRIAHSVSTLNASTNFVAACHNYVNSLAIMTP